MPEVEVKVDSSVLWQKVVCMKKAGVQRDYTHKMNCFSEVNDGNKISPRSANSRAVQVDRGEKTMVAKRMHAIRKAFDFILEIYVTN